VSFWLVLIAAGLVTFLMRLSFIAAEGRFTAPAWFRAMLPFVPVATLTALVAPALVRPGGVWDLSPGSPRLVAGAIAIAVAAWKRNALLTIAVGFGAFVVLRVAGAP
jgi:branched-subunit amino acid transport protein